MRLTRTCKRTPLMPMGPGSSWLSTMYSRGQNVQICRSASTGMARAPSSTVPDSTRRHLAAPRWQATPPKLGTNVASGDACVHGADLDAGHGLGRIPLHSRSTARSNRCWTRRLFAARDKGHCHARTVMRPSRPRRPRRKPWSCRCRAPDDFRPSKRPFMDSPSRVWQS